MTQLGAVTDQWTPKIGYGDRLRRIRLTLDMNQKEFAESIGMGSGSFAQHELRVELPRNARMVANSIELRHGVPAWWVLGEEAPGGGDGLLQLDLNQQPFDIRPTDSELDHLGDVIDFPLVA